MPSKSKSQAKFMAAAAHDPAFAKRNDISQDVAQDFNKADEKEGNLKKGSKLPQKVKKKTNESDMRSWVDVIQDAEIADDIKDEDHMTNDIHKHADDCQCNDCCQHNKRHHFYEEDEQEYDLQGKPVEPGQASAPIHAGTSTERLQEMPQRFDSFQGQDRDEFVDKTSQMTGKHNMVPFSEHDEYDVYRNKNGTGFIAYDKNGQSLGIVSGHVSNDAVLGVPKVFEISATASKSGTKGIIYNIFMDMINDGYKILSDKLHTQDAINFWTRLIGSHQVYIVGNGEVLAKATPEKVHKYWSDDENSPSAELQLLLVK